MLAKLQKLTINSLLKHTDMMKPSKSDLKQLYLYTTCVGLFLRIQIAQCFYDGAPPSALRRIEWLACFQFSHRL